MALRITSTTQNSISFEWDEVERATYLVRAQLGAAVKKSAELPVGTTSYTFTGLVSDTAYQIRVWSIIGGAYTFRGAATGRTKAMTVTPTSMLRVTGTTDTSISVAWDAVSGATSYRLEAADGNRIVSQGTASGTTFTFSNLVGNTEYTLRLYATVSGAENLAATLKHTITVSSSLMVTGDTQMSISLSWTEVANATYTLEVLEGSSLTDTASPTGTTHTFTGLEAGTEYTLRLYVTVGGVKNLAATLTHTITVIVTPPPIIDPLDPTPIAVVPKTLALKYQVTKADGSVVDISRQVTVAKLQFGVLLGDGYRPFAKSRGEINVNDWRGQFTDYEMWRSVEILAGSDTVYKLSIISVGVYGAYGRLRIFVELLGSANLPLDPVPRGGAGTHLSLESFLGFTSISFSRPPNVSLPNIFVALGAAYNSGVQVDQRGATYSVTHRSEGGGSELIEDVCTFGTLLAFERPRVEGFRVYPVEHLGSDSRRAAAAGRVGADTLVRRPDFRVEADEWNYDGQVYNTQGGGSTVESKDSVQTGTRGTHHSGRRYTIPIGDLLNREEQKEFGGYVPGSVSIGGLVTGGTKWINIDLNDDGRIVLSQKGNRSPWPSSRFSVRVTFSWYKVKPINTRQEAFGGDERRLETSGLPIPQGDSGDRAKNTASEATIRAKLQFTNGYWPRIVVATVLLPQSESLDALQVECGDIVEINKGDADDRCLLCGVEFQHRGLRAIELRWHGISLGPIPQRAPGPPLPDERVLMFDGRDVEFGGEAVRFG